MFDSIARAHFYRSLHKTIETFKTINSNDHSDDTEVLDFKLFQALHGHTAVNAYALFNGSVFPTYMTDSAIESREKGINHFFNYFQCKGYHTLYQDDMCFKGIWGFRQDVGGSRNWIELYHKLKENKY